MTLLQFLFVFTAAAMFAWLHPDLAFLAVFVLVSRWIWKWTG